MAAHSPGVLAQKINPLLDGQGFFDHWAEKFRDPQKLGPRVKCYCPFHFGEGFRSFLFDLKRNTFRCTFTQCKASFSGTLPELHALLVDKPLVDGILDLVTTFKIKLPEDLHLELTDALAERARQLMVDGKLDAAENAAVLALKDNPTRMVFRLLLAEICERRKRPGDAVPYYVSAIQESLESKDWDRSEAILDRLCSLKVDPATSMSLAVEVAESRGNPARAVKYLLSFAALDETTPEQKQEWLEKARTLDPNNLEVLQQIADLSGNETHTDSPVVWEALVSQCVANKQLDRALEVLERATQALPDRVDLQERRAELLLSTGRTESARESLQTLAARFQESGEVERAVRCLRRLCESDRDDLDSLRQLVALLAADGRIDDATFAAETFLERAEAAGDVSHHAEILGQLKQWHPSSLLYREQLAKHFIGSNELDSVVTELQELADILFAKGLSGEAIEHLKTIQSMAADQPSRRLEIAQILANRGGVADAVAEFGSIAGDALESDPPLAEEACRLGLELDPSNLVLNENYLQLLLAERPGEAIGQCRKLVDIHRKRGNVDRAVQMLGRLKATLSDQAGPRILAAETLAEVNRPDGAIAELGEVVESDLTVKEHEAVLQVAEAIATRHGERADLLQTLVKLHRTRNDIDALVDTLLRLASVQISVGSNEEAEATYLEIFAIRPGEARALLGHAELVRIERGFNAAKPLYQRYVEQLLSAGRGEEAASVYLHCIDWAPDDVDVRRALAALLAEQGDIENARKHWEAAASTYLAVHENADSAIECYEAILAHCRDDIDVRKNLARLFAQTGDPDAARSAFCRAADEFGARQDHEAQVETYREALEVLPNDAALIRGLAVSLQACGRDQEAAVAMEDLLAALDVDDDKHPEELLATLRTLVDLAPEKIELRERLARELADSGETGAAAEHYAVMAMELTGRGEIERAVGAREWIRDHQPDDVANRKALIDLQRKLDDPSKLDEELDNLAQTYRRLQQPQSAIDVMKERLALQPDDVDLAIEIAEVRQEAGDASGASEDFRRLAEELYKNNEPERARGLIERALKLRPDDARFRRKLIKVSMSDKDKSRVAVELAELAETFFRAGEPDEAMDCCKQLLKMGRKDPDIHLNVARVYARNGLSDEARDTYNRALVRSQKNKSDEKTLEVIEAALADFPEDENLWEKRIDAERRLEDAEAAAASALKLARLLRRREERPDKIESVYQSALQAGEKSPDVLSEVADFYVEQNRVEEASRLLNDVARIYEEQDNKDAAIETLNRICKFRPSDVDTLKSLARLSDEVGDYESVHDYHLRLGQQHVTQGNWAEAEAVYGALLEESDYAEKSLPMLIRIAREQGDADKEKEYSQKWTQFLEDKGRTGEAIESCTRILERNPDESDTLWKLAELHGRQGDGEQQVAALLRVASLCENSGEFQRATAARLQIQTLDPENLDNLNGLAELYQRTDRADAAIRTWREVLDAATRRSDPAWCVSVARRLLELDGSLNSVRKTLAENLAELDQTDEAADAWSQLGKQLAGEDPAEAIAVFRRALQFQSHRAADREALAALLVQEEETGAAVSEYFQAAKDFSKAGDVSHGIACLEAIVALEPEHRMAREMLVQMRLEAGESDQAAGEAVALADRAVADGRIDDAERILQKAAEAGPENAPLACERLAELQAGEGRVQEALAQLAPLVETARRQRQPAKIIEYLERICELVPVDHEHRIELIELTLGAGNLRKALQHFRKLLPILSRMDLVSECDRVGQLLLASAGDDWDIKEEIARAYAQSQMRDLAAMTYLDMATTARGQSDYERVTDFASAALGLCPDSIHGRELMFETNLALNLEREAFLHAGELTRLYDDADQTDKALKIAKRMLELAPEDPLGHERLTALLEKQGAEDDLCAALDHLTDLYLKLGDKPKAAETLARHLVIRPDATEVRKRYVQLAAEIGDLTGLSDEYLLLIEEATENGRNEEAVELFKRALDLDPSNVELRERWAEFLFAQERFEEGNTALIDLAERLTERNRIKKAIDLIENAAKESPNSGAIVEKLGDLHLRQNSTGRAIECFKEAAQLFGQTENRPAAHTVLDRILEVDPLDRETRSALIDSLFETEETDLALQHCRILADQYAERNLLDLAEGEYRRIVKHNPDDLSAWNGLLSIVEQMGNEAEHIDEYVLMAEAFARRGLLEDAAKHYRKVIDLDPENIVARRAYIEVHLQVGVEGELVPDYLELAQRLEELGQVEEARGYYERVLMVEPKNTEALKLLHEGRPPISDDPTVAIRSRPSASDDSETSENRRVPFIGGKNEKPLREAIENYQQILKSKPENAMVRTRLGDLLYQIGEVDEAIQEWEQASEHFMSNGELSAVIDLCEKILKIDPGRTGVRDRLSRASLKKDSMAAIESAIESLEDDTFDFDEPGEHENDTLDNPPGS